MKGLNKRLFIIGLVLLLLIVPSVAELGAAMGKDSPKYVNKKISFLGDSITTFKGCTIDRRVHYPCSRCGVDKVEETWWKQVADGLKADIGVNNSSSGAALESDGEYMMLSDSSAVRKLGDEGAPDIIVFFGGTNDIAFGPLSDIRVMYTCPIGEINEDTLPMFGDMETQKWDTFAQYYAAAVMRLKYLYPKAQVVAVFPLPNTVYYTRDTLSTYIDVMKSVCEHYDVLWVNAAEMGFDEKTMLGDGTHPNEKGMKFISDCVLKVLSEN